MIRVELSETADADLVDILDYGTEAFGEEQVGAYVKSFDDTFELISRHPLAGAVHDEVRPPIRACPTEAIAYFTTSSMKEVVVQRIPHKAVDVLRHL